MIRNRLVATAVLAIGASAAVLAADLPLLPRGSEPAPVVEQLPDHVIKVEIGFDPHPLEESPPRLIASDSMILPVSVVPAHITPPMPSVANIDGPKKPALSLAALERMALRKPETPKAVAPGGPRLALAPVSAASPPDGEASRPIRFVDQVVNGDGKTQSADPMQTAMQQYRLLNTVRLHYYHLLALQRMIGVREELAGISRDAVTAIEGMTTTGQATKAELLQAKVEAREQAAALQTAKAVRDAVWRRMAALVGQPNLPVGPLAGDLEQCCLTPRFDAAWVHLVEASPELLAARTEVARRQASLRQNLNAKGEKSGDGLFNQALASIVNGPFQARDPQVKQAAWNDLSRCEAEVGRVEQSLRFRLADAYGRCERAKEVVDLYRTQNLPDAKEAFELSVVGYRQGRGSWPQVQIAQRNYFRLCTEYVEAVADLRRTELSILGLVMDVPGDPQSAVKQAMHQSK